MIYALLGVNAAAITAIVVVSFKAFDVVVARELSHRETVERLLVRIQAPDSPQVTMLEPAAAAPARRTRPGGRSEADEIDRALKDSAALLAENGIEVPA